MRQTSHDVLPGVMTTFDSVRSACQLQSRATERISHLWMVCDELIWVPLVLNSGFFLTASGVQCTQGC